MIHGARQYKCPDEDCKHESDYIDDPRQDIICVKCGNLIRKAGNKYLITNKEIKQLKRYLTAKKVKEIMDRIAKEN